MEFNMKLNVAIYKGNVQAFKFQSTNCEVVEAEVDAEYINQPIFTEHQIPQFYLDNGIVKRRTDDEIKAMPEYVEYVRGQRQKRYEKEVDPLTLEAIRLGVSTSAGIELKRQANEKVAQIKSELPY